MSKIKSNIIYNLIYQILVLIVPLITSPYVSRVLGVKGVGIYSYVSSVAYYFFILITLGLANYGNRSIAQHRGDRKERSQTFWSIYFMQIGIGVCVSIIYIIYVLFLVDVKYKFYFGVYTIYIISACLDINWFFFGMEDFKFTTIRNTIVKIVTVVTIFSFVKGDNAFFIVAGSTLLSNVILWTKVFENVDFYKPCFNEILVHIKPNIILFLPVLAISIYRVMDKIMIKQMSGITQNGYYENADRIITISMTVFSAVATVMMPAISNMVANKEDNIVKRMLEDMMQIVCWLSIAMIAGLSVISREFAPLFFGKEFIETGYLLIGLTPTIFLSGWKNVLRSQYLIPYERDNAYVISLICGAIINVIVNFIFIPKYGARGAVIGTIFAELIGFIIQTYVASKDINIITLTKNAIVFVPAGFIMGIFVYKILQLMPNSLLSILISILLGGISYLVLSLICLYMFDKLRFKYFITIFLKKEKKNVTL